MTGDRRIVRSADGFPLHCTVTGTGAVTLVLIHGWSCDQEFWREQFGLFAPFRQVTLDLLGHGLSRAAVGERAWSMASFAADVEAVADALAADSIVIVGHSMGGAVAVESALRLGPRCRFVLGVDTFTETTFYRRRPAAEIAERLRPFERDFSLALEAMVEKITARGIEPATRAWIARGMSRTDASVAVAVLEQLLDWDIEARWPLLRCPVETINSALLRRRDVGLSLPHLGMHEMEGVGHFPMLENAPAFNALAQTILVRYNGRS